MFHFHKWSDWIVEERGRLVDKWNKDLKLGAYVSQSRFCHKCGKTQCDVSRTTVRQDLIMIPETVLRTPKHDFERQK